MTEAWRRALTHWFGDDLQVLLRRLGAEFEYAEELTRLVSRRQRKASFKLVLTDGRSYQARRCATDEHHIAMAELAPALDARRFSAVVDSHGTTFIEAWVPGTPLEAPAVTTARAREAHGIPHTAERHCPAAFDTGLIHGDFCADNMVISAGGALMVVDNETLRPGALDFDVARSWCRCRVIGTVRPSAPPSFYGKVRTRPAPHTARLAREWFSRAICRNRCRNRWNGILNSRFQSATCSARRGESWALKAASSSQSRVCRIQM